MAPADEAQLIAAAESLNLEFRVNKDQQTDALLDGQQVNDELRSEACGEMASKVAPIAAVRQALLNRQKAFQRAPGPGGRRPRHGHGGGFKRPH